MEFSGDAGFWQRRIAESREGISRRLVTIEALSIETGQAIIELGCGAGHLVRDIGLAVGETGRAVGLELSAEQLETAASLCDGLAQVELIEGTATDLSFEDETFDGLASIQVLDYIAEVDQTITEARRVLRTGGRIASISVLWDHWRFHGADPDLNDQMFELWRDHCEHQMLPLEMPRKLSMAGFDGVTQRPIGFLNGNMHDNAFARSASRLVAAFAISKGVSEQDVTLWLNQLSVANREGRFGFVSMPVLTTAIAV